MALSVDLENPKRISNLPRFLYKKSSYDQSNLFDLRKPIGLMITNNWMILVGRRVITHSWEIISDDMLHMYYLTP